MKYLVREIVRSIRANAPDTAQTSIIRVDHMPHPGIYLEVCRQLRQLKGDLFQPHLSLEKYAEFQRSDPTYQPILNQLLQEGYVDNDGRMTYWRNSSAETSGLILLMGTEAVDDRGGLADFYAITPSSIEYALRRNYEMWLEGLISGYREDWKDKANRFFEKLFQYVPLDLLKFSRILEEIEVQAPMGINDLLEILCDRPYTDWGLPRISGSHAMERRLRLIDQAVKFKDRTDYSDGLSESQRERILEKFERYIKKNPDIAIDPDYRYRVAFSSFDEFKQSILEYVSGISLDKNRELLFRCDFSLISDILSTPVASRERRTTPKVHGSPLEVILTAMFKTCQNMLESEEPVQELAYKIRNVQVAGCSTDQELWSSWQSIAYWAGGVMDFLSRESWTLLGNEVRIRWDHEFDPFSPKESDRLIEEGFIHKAAASKKLTKIEFQVTALPSGKSFSYVWEFEPLNRWSQAFAVLSGSLREVIEQDGSSYLPIGSSSKVSEITELTSEDDFLAAIEGIRVEFTNLMDIIGRLPSGTDVVGQSMELAKSFVAFAKDLWENGFYSTFADENGSGVAFVSCYSKVMNHLSNTSYCSMVEQQLHLISNAFLITPSPREGVEHKAVSAALVPPFHPAMLEKMQAQAQFVRQGAAELLERLGSQPSLRVADEFERLLQLSTITSGVDVLVGPSDECLPVKNTFGYYSLYQTSKQREIVLSALVSSNYDVVSDDTSSLTELRKATPLSRLFVRQVREYLNTYPFQGDELSLLFINSPDLQPVVSAIHEVVQDLKEWLPRVRIKLYVLLPSLLQSGRSYLRYWLDNYFSEGDNVSIQTFCNGLDWRKGNPKALLREVHVDIAFVQNPLETSTCRFEPMNEVTLPVSESRFPMVYAPLPISKTAVQRLMSASQTQFQAAHLHTQLARKLISKHFKQGFYRLVKEMTLREEWDTFLDLLHDQAHWVVCIDSGIDKDLLHRSSGRIISFSTGEGPFGEYNYTVSSNQTLQTDIAARLRAQLKRKFPGWPDDSLTDIADNCLEQSKKLDGIRLLRALNPRDYEMHNFLAYILTAQEFGLTGDPDPNYAIRTLVSLDAYAHWFDGSSTTNKHPDFLLLEIPKGDNLHIRATIIECKMGFRSEAHINKAFKQLLEGYKLLSRHWDPRSKAVDKRYWYAQLYRVLVFSKINIEDNSSEYETFVAFLDNILSGQFSIEWRAEILGFWLDQDSGVLPSETFPGEDGLEIMYRPFGQLYIQRMLRSPQHRNQTVTFLVPASDDLSDDEEGFVAIGSEDIGDAGDESDEPPVSDIAEPIVDILDASSRQAATSSQSQEPRSAETVLGPRTDLGQTDVSTSASVSQTTPRMPVRETNLESVRVLIGEDIRTKEKVYWEFGHPQLPNRHILISGNSGTGKTYLIQSMMLELSRSGISCMVFDYTDGFTQSKLEPEFRQYLADKIVEFPVYHKPFPINPFKRHEIEVAGRMVPQKTVDVAERIKSVFQAVYDFGDQQASAIYRATRNGLEKYGDDMNLRHLQSELRSIISEIPNAKTVLSKIEPLVDRGPFDSSGTQDWSKIHEGKGMIFIVQLSGFTRDVQLIVTEMILWDAWYYNVKYGRKDLPFPVILDEAQNLDHGDRAPSTMILTEGRKFGWSGWFATQFMKAQLKPEEIQRLQQASQKIYFNPPEAEIPDIATAIEPDKDRRSDWHARLSQLRKGECIVVGYELRGGRLEKRPPRIVRVSSIAERIK